MKVHPLIRGAVGLAAVLALAGGAAESAAPPKSGILEYDVKITAPNQPPRKMAQKIWMKGPNFRVEMTMAMGNQTGKQLTVGNAGGVYVLAPGMTAAMKLPDRLRTKGSIPGLMFGDVAKIRQQKKIGSEKVGRYATDIYEQSTDVKMPGSAQGQKGSTRFWISRDLPIPVKVVSKMPPSFESVAVLKSAQLNQPIADNLFQLPKGTKVMPMPNSPGMGGPPGGRPR